MPTSCTASVTVTEGRLKALRPSSHQHFTTCHYHPALICKFHFQNNPPSPLCHVQEGKRERESGSSALCCNLRDRRGQMSSSHVVLSRQCCYKQMVLHLFREANTDYRRKTYISMSTTPHSSNFTHPPLSVRRVKIKTQPQATQPPKEGQCTQSHMHKCGNWDQVERWENRDMIWVWGWQWRRGSSSLSVMNSRVCTDTWAIPSQPLSHRAFSVGSYENAAQVEGLL